jgi:aquaporin related protein
MFLFFAFSATQVANEGASSANANNNLLSHAPNPSVLLYISLAFGLSLAVNVWCFYRVTGGLFNPAVSGAASP